jgi:hypothetical protein
LQSDLQNLSELQKAVAKHDLSKVGYWLQRRSTLEKHRWSAWTRRLESEIVVEAITSTGQVKDFEPRDGEAFGPLLLRHADEAVEKGDWQRVYGLLEVYKTLYGEQVYSQPWLNAEMAAVQSFIQGQSFERSDDINSAIEAYRSVLRHTAARVPRKEAETRLAALRKEHSEYFEPKSQSGASIDVKVSGQNPAQAEKKANDK